MQFFHLFLLLVAALFASHAGAAHVLDPRALIARAYLGISVVVFPPEAAPGPRPTPHRTIFFASPTIPAFPDQGPTPESTMSTAGGSGSEAPSFSVLENLALVKELLVTRVFASANYVISQLRLVVGHKGFRVNDPVAFLRAKATPLVATVRNSLVSGAESVIGVWLGFLNSLSAAFGAFSSLVSLVISQSCSAVASAGRSIASIPQSLFQGFRYLLKLSILVILIVMLMWVVLPVVWEFTPRAQAWVAGWFGVPRIDCREALLLAQAELGRMARDHAHYHARIDDLHVRLEKSGSANAAKQSRIEFLEHCGILREDRQNADQIALDILRRKAIAAGFAASRGPADELAALRKALAKQGTTSDEILANSRAAAAEKASLEAQIAGLKQERVVAAQAAQVQLGQANARILALEQEGVVAAQAAPVLLQQAMDKIAALEADKVDAEKAALDRARRARAQVAALKLEKVVAEQAAFLRLQRLTSSKRSASEKAQKLEVEKTAAEDAQRVAEAKVGALEHSLEADKLAAFNALNAQFAEEVAKAAKGMAGPAVEVESIKADALKEIARIEGECKATVKAVEDSAAAKVKVDRKARAELQERLDDVQERLDDTLEVVDGNKRQLKKAGAAVDRLRAELQKLKPAPAPVGQGAFSGALRDIISGPKGPQ
ncbi:hypothetical protein EJ05DRAFT_529213 [Pseudovirgaria hyperparasitica]|uniref:Uncharacterized protein n=1 Tax=Pseudovirgaria hyperparasitica TaxID=470096 RepID=A0A6A6W651_9PEZI|nr:uncharacterized protein EJ05DRAFT_529213 [Pseudovirgaria hyperparasitica]KAF2757504.1 hypothetical protein EJ05DRAFT_529213 [Pseudovirgaria hyperparasitica]